MNDDRIEHDAYWAWRDDVIDAIDAACAAHGWTENRRSGLSFSRSSRSEYHTYSRELNDEDIEEIKVRISDHGSAHCSEDYSIAMMPSGDDHTLEQVVARFART